VTMLKIQFFWDCLAFCSGGPEGLTAVQKGPPDPEHKGNVILLNVRELHAHQDSITSHTNVTLTVKRKRNYACQSHKRTEVQEHIVTFGNRIRYCDNIADSTV